MRNPIRTLVAASVLAGATALVTTPTEARTVVSFGVGLPAYGGYYAPPVAIGYGYGYGYGPYWRGAYRPYWHRPYRGRPWGWRRGWYGRPYGWRRW